MKWYYKPLIFLTLVACQKEDAIDPTDTVVNAYELIDLTNKFGIDQGSISKWTVNTAPTECYALSAINNTCYFIASEPGEYILENKSENQIYNLRVKDKGLQPSPFLSNVFQYEPAPGQFVNELPYATSDDTPESVLAKVKDAITNTPNGDLVTLGGFGGYIVAGFQYPIINVKGEKDLLVLGNAATGKTDCEPGVISVSYDWNHNGIPDDEWYEINGQVHDNKETLRDYQITYQTPQENQEQHYIAWSDNQGKNGYISKNDFHKQSYYPTWMKQKELTFTGTRLPDNAYQDPMNPAFWIFSNLGSGYCDNYSNLNPQSSIDIDWARNSRGEAVDLPAIHFVRIHTAVNQQCGHLGEVSTEISGAINLHLHNPF